MTQDTHLTGGIINFKTIKLIIYVSSFKNNKTETDEVVYIFIIFNELIDFISILHENLGYIFGKERNKFQIPSNTHQS